MWPEKQIPIQSSTPENRQPIERHHTASYYAHRVKESLTTKISKLICAIFLALLLLVAITTFILWLSLRPHRPRFHVEEFSIPAFARQSGFENAKIVYNATTRNANQNIGIYYDSMHLTVYYQEQSIGGCKLLFPFYQEPKNTTAIAGELGGGNLTVTSQRWQQFMADLVDGEVVFRFDITSTIRFKISTWDSKRHIMHANCPVGVGPDGLILPSYKDKRCPVYFV